MERGAASQRTEAGERPQDEPLASGAGGPEEPAAAEAPAEDETADAPAADGADEATAAGEDESPAEPSEGEQEDPRARAERERDEYLALARRTQADFENYRKRAAKDSAAAGTRAKAALARELLPAIDNLERALSSVREGDGGLAEGVRLVHAELVAAFRRAGVESFDPAGEAFDPTLHEALTTQPADGAEPGVVLNVVEKGYRLGDTILRPARVVVSA